MIIRMTALIPAEYNPNGNNARATRQAVRRYRKGNSRQTTNMLIRIETWVN